MITSFQNQRVKDAIKLRNSKQRRNTGQYAIAGAREILRAIECNVSLVELFVCQELCQDGEQQQALTAAQQHQVELISVSKEVFEKLAYGDRYDGLLAVATMDTKTLADLPSVEGALIAVIENIEKPGNLGAILRSADGAGLTGVIVTDPVTDLYNPNCIRASMGTIFSLPICTATAESALQWLLAHDFQIVTTRVDAEQNYTQVDYTQATAIVLGGEAAGLSDVWTGEKVTAVQLPMRGIADSLNVSTSAAVMFYEALRQRQL